MGLARMGNICLGEVLWGLSHVNVLCTELGALLFRLCPKKELGGGGGMTGLYSAYY